MLGRAGMVASSQPLATAAGLRILRDGGIEDAVAVETVAELQRRGHPLQVAGGWERISFGRGQIIRRDRDGVLWGGSDPRADGCAMSLP